MLDHPYYDDVHFWTYTPVKNLYLNIRNPQTVERQMIQYRQWIRQARRFVIDDEMTKLVSDASTRIDKMPLWIELSRLPFDVCWFEWDNHAKLKAAQNRLAGPLDLDDTSQAHGYLMVRDQAHEARWVAFCFQNVKDKDGQNQIWPLPAAFVIDPEGIAEAPANGVFGMKRVSEEFGSRDQPGNKSWIAEDREYASLGLQDASGKMSIPDWARYRIAAVTEPLNRQFIRANQLEQARSKIEAGGVTSMSKDLIEDSLLEQRGIARFLISLLAAINDIPMLYRGVDARSGHRTKRANKVQYLSHSVVSIKAPKTKPLDWFVKKLDAAHGRRRRHEVRGYWRRMIDRKTKVATGRKWIEPHMRGDASLGFVTRTFIVEPNRD